MRGLVFLDGDEVVLEPEGGAVLRAGDVTLRLPMPLAGILRRLVTHGRHHAAGGHLRAAKRELCRTEPNADPHENVLKNARAELVRHVNARTNAAERELGSRLIGRLKDFTKLDEGRKEAGLAELLSVAGPVDEDPRDLGGRLIATEGIEEILFVFGSGSDAAVTWPGLLTDALYVPEICAALARLAVARRRPIPRFSSAFDVDALDRLSEPGHGMHLISVGLGDVSRVSRRFFEHHGSAVMPRPDLATARSPWTTPVGMKSLPEGVPGVGLLVASSSPWHAGATMVVAAGMTGVASSASLAALLDAILPTSDLRLGVPGGILLEPRLKPRHQRAPAHADNKLAVGHFVAQLARDAPYEILARHDPRGAEAGTRARSPSRV